MNNITKRAWNEPFAKRADTTIVKLDINHFYAKRQKVFKNSLETQVPNQAIEAINKRTMQWWKDKGIEYDVPSLLAYAEGQKKHTLDQILQNWNGSRDTAKFVNAQGNTAKFIELAIVMHCVYQIHLKKLLTFNADEAPEMIKKLEKTGISCVVLDEAA